MPLDHFRDALRLLLNLDRTDVPFLSEPQWCRFRDDPHRFFLKADSRTASDIWSVLQARLGGLAG